MERLLIIVGREKDERATAFVIGAFNEEYLNQLPLEDAEDQINKLKNTWTYDPVCYDWREITVSIPLDLDTLFSPEIEGVVE